MLALAKQKTKDLEETTRRNSSSIENTLVCLSRVGIDGFVHTHIKYTLGDWYGRVPTTAIPSDAQFRKFRPV